MLASAETSYLDQGPRIKKSGTERLCAVTRQVRPTDELIRFVLGPNDEVVPDLKRRLPGRGVWVSASRETLAKAVKRGIFAKGFGKTVKDQQTLVAQTEQLLVQSVIDALAIAAKAGQVLAGAAKVENCLKAGDARALIHAIDGAPDGIRKLNSLISRQREGESAAFPVINVLTSAELDLALNRTNVIHAALLAGPAGDTFLSRTERLARFQTSEAGETTHEISGSKARAVAFRD